MHRRAASTLVLVSCLFVASRAVAQLEEVWTTVFDEASFYRVMTVGPDGTIFWSGAVGEGGTDPPPEALRGYSPEGAEIWERPIDGSVWALAPTADGEGVIVVGAEAFENFPGTPWVARHRASNGRQQWRVDLDDVELGLAGAVAVGDDGSIYVSGRTEFPDREDAVDAFVAKLSSQGAILWFETWDEGRLEEGTAIAVDDERVVVAGTTTQDDVDAFTAAFSLEGALEFATVRDFRGRYEYPSEVRLDPRGKWIYVAGNLVDGEGGLPAEAYLQRVKVKNGRAKKLRRQSVSPMQHTTDLEISADGKSLYLGLFARLPAPGPFSGVILETRTNGVLMGQLAAYQVEEDADTFQVDMELAPDGSLVVGGALGAPGSGLEKAYLRKMAFPVAPRP